MTISKEFFFGRLFLFVDSKWAVCRHLTYLSGLDNDLLSLLLSGANRYNSKSRAARAALQLIRHFLSLSLAPSLFFNNLSFSVSLVMADAFIFTAVFHSASPSSASAFRSIAQRCTDAHRLLVGWGFAPANGPCMNFV
jgi:hypothetical protein